MAPDRGRARPPGESGGSGGERREGYGAALIAGARWRYCRRQDGDQRLRVWHQPIPSARDPARPSRTELQHERWLMSWATEAVGMAAPIVTCPADSNPNGGLW